MKKKISLSFPKNLLAAPFLIPMSRRFPNLEINILGATITADSGVMALELAGVEEQVDGAIRFMRESGVTIEHFGDVS